MRLGSSSIGELNPERWQLIKSVFGSIVAAPRDQRPVLLGELCADDELLRAQVEGLLVAHDQASGFLETSPSLHTTRSLINERLGPYHVLQQIGCGGMGDVYTARDTRLDRVVALKVLSGHIAAAVEGFDLVTAEARAVAALNHPNVCALHDVFETDGAKCLVMEYIEGETLQHRLAKRRMTPAEAVRVAIEIASALDAVHRAGLVHRDLKPSNIMLTKRGVKVLDFGLSTVPIVAAAAGSANVSGDAVASLNHVFGSTAYAAPEQHASRYDARSDIFSLGAILFEMIEGRRLFTDGSGGSTDVLPLTVSPSVGLTRTIQTCVANDPDERWQTARDLHRQLVWNLSELETANAAKQPIAIRWLRPLALAVLAGAVGFTAIWRAITKTPPPPSTARFEIETPFTAEPLSFDMSDDGQQLAFVARDQDGRSRLWVRTINRLDAVVIDGTDDATFPFWSPDGTAVAFFAAGALRRVDLRGGPPRVLAPAPNGRGGTWNRNDVIVFAPTTTGPLLRISAEGGQTSPVTHLASGENSHRWPQFLPDGRHFLYLSTHGDPGTEGNYVGDVDNRQGPRILTDDSPAVYAAGHLLVIRTGGLFATPFDAARLVTTGDPLQVEETVGFDGDLVRGAFSVRQNILIARRAIAARRQLTWFDHTGRKLGTVGDADDDGLAAPEISRDRSRVAVFRSVRGNTDIWTLPLTGGGSTRLTSDAGLDGFPVWTPDSKHVTFMTLRHGVYGVVDQSSFGDPERPLLSRSELRIPLDYSRDGHFLLYAVQRPATGVDLWAADVGHAAEERVLPVATSAFDEMAGQFSPDGHWVAFQSNASGGLEIYVRQFPAGELQQQVSVGGGAQPRWSANGRVLYYMSATGFLTAVSLRFNPTRSRLELGTPTPLFRVRLASGANVPPAVGTRAQYAVADGKFLMNVEPDSAPSPPLLVVLNWASRGRIE